jgi:hypothetical protein
MSTDVNDKPKYEIPVVMSLGEQARAVGAACENGTGPGTGTCNVGVSGFSNCTNGNEAIRGDCDSGSGPKTTCTQGGSPPN